MRDKIFGVLQRVGRSFMLPIAILPVAGVFLGLGSSFTNETMIKTYGLSAILREGTVLHALLIIMNKVGSAIFDNLPLIFAVGVAIGMAKREKEVAALSSVLAYFVMNTGTSAMLQITGKVLEDGFISPDVLDGSITNVCGIQTLQMGAFGGIIVGLGVAALHNKFYKIELPNALSFFGGTRFVPIVSTIVYMIVGILMYFIWPTVQNGIYALGGLVTGTGYIGTLIFGLVKRSLIPFGLHHVFYIPFWHTAVGGTMEVAGEMVQGAQNIFFAQLANSANITHFSTDATRYFSGEFIFMIFGLPGGAFAMYRCAKPERRKKAGGLLLSAALACMLTGITEPLEFSFLFVAPMLFVVHVILEGFAYMIAHILNIAIGLTFSAGLLDFFLFGILQGNSKTNWILVLPLGILYFFLYYFIFSFFIKRFDLKTPGREEEKKEEKQIQAGNARKSEIAYINAKKESDVEKRRIIAIVRGLGGKENISEIDCCVTRLHCIVVDSKKINSELLRATGASGVLNKGKGVQIVYGPKVAVIKSNLENYLESFENEMISDNHIRKLEDERIIEDEMIAVTKEQKKKKSKELIKTIIIGSPVSGEAADLCKVPDEAFASRMMGDGVAITPLESLIVAPEDGEASFIFDTKHAIGFLTDSGIGLLLHIGIDTVKLGGKGFEVLVEQGQKVKKGEPMIKLDLDYLSKNAPSLMSPFLCTQLKENEKVRLLKEGEIKSGEALFAIDIYE